MEADLDLGMGGLRIVILRANYAWNRVGATKEGFDIRVGISYLMCLYYAIV